MVSGLLFYSDVVPLNREGHRDHRIATGAQRFGFASGSNLVPAVIDEFAAAAPHLPIVFLPGPGAPAACFLTGVRSGRNALVGADGGWRGDYVPAYLRRYPFVLGEVEGADPLVCIDAGQASLEAPAGEALFKEDDGSQGLPVTFRNLAGVGSVVVNRINNHVTAEVGAPGSGSGDTALKVSALDVTAANDASIRGAAGALGVGQGSNALGLSVVYDSIGGDISATVAGADVTSSRDVTVQARSDGDILSVALGVALARPGGGYGAGIALAGSAATSILSTNLTASITDGADIQTQGNVAVLADNASSISVVSGAAGVGKSVAGGGLSVVVNEVGGATSAFVSGAATRVDAKGVGTALTVSDGVLANPFDVSSADNPDLTAPDMSEGSKSVTGLAVVATSRQAIAGVSVTLGGASSIGAAISPVTSLLSGATRAYIENAQVDARLTGADQPGVAQVDVSASSVSYSRNLIVTLAGAGRVAGSGAVSATQMERATDAHIRNATIGDAQTPDMVGAVSVRANATEVASDVVVGGAVGGMVGAAASVIVDTFAATTSAYVDGGAMDAASLEVRAKTQTGWFAASGAGAGGGNVGVAGGFVIGLSENTTKAYIGAQGHDTVVNVTGDLSVDARTENQFNSFAIGGAGAGLAAVAGMLNLAIIENETTARLDQVVNTRAVGGDVSVTASDQVTVTPTTGAGALAIKGAGIGAGVNVVMLGSSVAAQILGSTLNATGAVTVGATSDKVVDAETVTVGAGGSAGIGAAVGVVILGGAASSEMNKEISGTIAAANATTSTLGSSDAGAALINEQSAAAPSGIDAEAALRDGSDSNLSAQIIGGSINAGSVSVTAADRVTTKNMATGVGVGGGAGVGAAVALTRIGDGVAAVIDAQTTASSIKVSASMTDGSSGGAVQTEAYAGAGALGTALGAAVAKGEVKNRVSARIAGTVTGDTQGAVSIDATDTGSVGATAVGATVGGGYAIGISLAFSDKASLITSSVAAGSVIGGYTTFTLNARGGGGVDAASIAGVGGGLLGAAGDAAIANDTSTVIAEIGERAVSAASGLSIPTAAAPTFADGAVKVTASYTPDVGAKAFGVVVAGSAGLGASVAMATAETKVTAQVDDGALFAGADLTVQALLSLAAGVNPVSVSADSTAGAGGVLLGGAGASATASNASTVLAAVGDGVGLPGGVVSINAGDNSSQQASATGVGVGFLAVGAVFATASADMHTTASLT